MIEFLQSVGAVWGLGAVFAILMFFILMRVFKIMREDRKYMEDRLTKLIDDYNRTSSDNTKVLWELIVWLRAKNGNKS